MKKKKKFILLLVGTLSLWSYPSLISRAWAFDPPSNDPAPPVELKDNALLRAQTILKGTKIVFRNGKFELE